MFNPTTFYSVLTPMFQTTTFFGLTAFSIDETGCKKSKIHLAWCLFLLSFINAYTLTILNQNRSVEQGLIASATDVIDAYIGQAVLLCSFFFGCFYVDEVLKVLHDITNFDNKMEKIFYIDLKKKYKDSKINAILALLAASIIAGPCSILTVIRSLNLLSFELMGELLSYVVPILVLTYRTLQYCVLVMCLYQRFVWINAKLTNVSNIFKNCQDSTHLTKLSSCLFSTKYFPSRVLHLVEELRIHHHDLCAISKILNKAYSGQLFLIFLQDGMILIDSFYYPGRLIIVNNKIPVDFFVYAGIQLVLSIGRILAIVVCSAITAMEANKTKILIHEILLTGSEKNLQNEVMCFSIQLLMQDVKFTACRAFTINEPLIFSIVGAITTYLVVAIQFEIQQAADGVENMYILNKQMFNNSNNSSVSNINFAKNAERLFNF